MSICLCAFRHLKKKHALHRLIGKNFQIVYKRRDNWKIKVKIITPYGRVENDLSRYWGPTM